MFGFVTDALKAAGNGIKTVSGGISGGIDSVGRVAGRLPVVGTPLHEVFDAASGPFKVTEGIMNGGRIDKVVYNDLKKRIKNAQTLAPYAQTVVSLVPGVGTGVSGMIGAANALSKGQPIDAALEAGVRGSLPGGPAAQAAFDMGVAAMKGQSITDVALQAIPLPPEQKQYVIAAAKATADMASGKKVDQAIIDRGLSVAPKSVREGLQVGVAMAHAKNLQQAMKTGAEGATKVLAKEGARAIITDPIFSAGLHSIPKEARTGFAVGVGVMGHKATPVALNAIRGTLNGKAQAGFDIALAARIGSTKKTILRGDHSVQFAKMVAYGAENASKNLQKRLGKLLFLGMSKSVQQVEAAKLAAKKAPRTAAHTAAMGAAAAAAAGAAANAKAFHAYKATLTLVWWKRALNHIGFDFHS